MWDARLGQVKMASEHIVLTSQDLRPVNPFPYSAGTKGSEFEKMETVKIPRMDVSVPAKSKWASLIKFP